MSGSGECSKASPWMLPVSGGYVEYVWTMTLTHAGGCIYYRVVLSIPTMEIHKRIPTSSENGSVGADLCFFKDANAQRPAWSHLACRLQGRRGCLIVSPER